jgi:hypothetical protein
LQIQVLDLPGLRFPKLAPAPLDTTRRVITASPRETMPSMQSQRPVRAPAGITAAVHIAYHTAEHIRRECSVPPEPHIPRPWPSYPSQRYELEVTRGSGPAPCELCRQIFFGRVKKVCHHTCRWSFFTVTTKVAQVAADTAALSYLPAVLNRGQLYSRIDDSRAHALWNRSSSCCRRPCVSGSHRAATARSPAPWGSESQDPYSLTHNILRANSQVSVVIQPR